MKRTNTGPLKLDGDWPGYFMRGDEALATAGILRAMAGKLDDPAIQRGAARYLIRLADRLATCEVPQKEDAAA